MKRASWRVLGTIFVLAIGVVVGMSFPGGRAQEAPAPEGDCQGGGPRARTAADAARERVEISEEDGRFTLTIYFPDKKHPRRTKWRVTCAHEDALTRSGPRENLVVNYAFFQPSPDSPEIQVLGQTYLAESMVCYSDGVRYYDIANHNGGLLTALPSDLGDKGFTIDAKKKIVCEVRDRGVHWKRGGDRSRRGEELVIWATIACGNYLYICQYGFHDDGTFQAKMGSTGSNLSSHVVDAKNHTHIAIWRVDVDFGERNSNVPYLVRHREPFGRASNSMLSVEPFNGGREGFADWNDREFTVLRIVNPKMKGKHGRPAAYDLISHRTGSARHFGDSPDETFTHHDYYVLQYREKKAGEPAETDCSQLLNYARRGEDLKGKDIVIWHMTSAHHVPRQEDMDGGTTGATCVVWSGFDLKPRDLFTGTPFYGTRASK